MDVSFRCSGRWILLPSDSAMLTVFICFQSKLTIMFYDCGVIFNTGMRVVSLENKLINYNPNLELFL